MPSSSGWSYCLPGGAAEGEAQVGDVGAARLRVVARHVHAHQPFRDELVRGFFHGFAHDRLLERFVRVEVAGRLVQRMPSLVSSSISRKRPSRSMMAATVTDGLKVWVMRVLENEPTFYLDGKGLLARTLHCNSFSRISKNLIQKTWAYVSLGL
jgi:hypothetical protein